MIDVVSLPACMFEFAQVMITLSNQHLIFRSRRLTLGQGLYSTPLLQETERESLLFTRSGWCSDISRRSWILAAAKSAIGLGFAVLGRNGLRFQRYSSHGICVA